MSASAASPSSIDRIGRAAPPIAAFAAGAGPVLLLGFGRGGYPVEVVAAYGMALTCVLLVGLLTDAIPRPRPTTVGLIVLGAIGGLVAWGLLSLSWTENRERGLTEVVRLFVAGGTLLLGMSAARSGQSRALLGGVFTGLAVIVAASALSRLQPDLFAGADETSRFLGSDTRTSWPLNYWNAVAAAGSMALALGVVLAVRARTAWTAAAAAAPLPVIVLGMAFTLSRGGILAAVVALAGAVLLVAPRLVVLRTLVAPAVGSVALLLAAYGSEPIADATQTGAQSADGRLIVGLAIFVTFAVALAQAGWTVADRSRRTPTLPRPNRRLTAALLGTAAVLVVALALAVGGPGRASDAWSDFRSPTVSTTGTDRLTSVSSNQRSQIWSGAIDAMGSHPVRGIGLGTWESWWAPRRADSGFVRNAHSEPLELLAETGLIGGILFLVVILGAPLAGAVSAIRRQGHPDAAPAVPALLAFGLAILVDWNWQIGAVMVAGMTIAAVPLARAPADEPPAVARAARRRPLRLARVTGTPIATTAVALVAFATLAVALVAPQGVADSRAAARAGDLAEASKHAATASAAAGFASSPALQLAIVEEDARNLDAAARAAKMATTRTPNDWRGWFVAARIAVGQGRTTEAVAFFRRARSLNPESDLLGRIPRGDGGASAPRGSSGGR